MQNIVFYLSQIVNKNEADKGSSSLKKYLDVNKGNKEIDVYYEDIEVTRCKTILLVHPNISRKLKKTLKQNYPIIFDINEVYLEDKMDAIAAELPYEIISKYSAYGTMKNGEFETFFTIPEDYREDPDYYTFVDLCYISLEKGLHCKTITYLEYDSLAFDIQYPQKIKFGDYLSEKMVKKIGECITDLEALAIFKEKIIVPFQEGKMILSWDLD